MTMQSIDATLPVVELVASVLPAQSAPPREIYAALDGYSSPQGVRIALLKLVRSGRAVRERNHNGNYYYRRKRR